MAFFFSMKAIDKQDTGACKLSPSKYVVSIASSGWGTNGASMLRRSDQLTPAYIGFDLRYSKSALTLGSYAKSLSIISTAKGDKDSSSSGQGISKMKI